MVVLMDLETMHLQVLQPLLKKETQRVGKKKYGRETRVLINLYQHEKYKP